MNSNTKRERLFYIDNLRVFLIILVIFFHAALTYGLAVGWYYYEYNSDTITLLILTFFVSVNQAFFMALLFAISGYFIPKSYNRRGFVKFLRDKFIKLVIPFILYVLFVIPLIQYQYVLHFENPQITFPAYYSQTILSFKALGSGPLWFVFVLFIFSVIYAFYRLVMRKRKIIHFIGMDFPKNRTIFMFILFLSIATFLLRIIVPFSQWFSLFNITYLDLSRIPQYACFFIFGLIGYYNKWFSKIEKSTGIFWTRISIASILFWPIMMVSGGILEGKIQFFSGGLHWQSLVYSAWESIICIGISISLIYLFKEKFNHQNKMTKYAASSSFTVYLIHTPIIIFIEYLLSGAAMYQFLKFLLVALGGTFISFSIAVGINRLTFMLKEAGRKYFKRAA